MFGLEGPHEFKSFGVLEPTLVIHWQFLNELNEGQQEETADSLEMNPDPSDTKPLPPNSERHRASRGTLGTKADFFFFQIITAFFCTGRPILYQYCHLGSLGKYILCAKACIDERLVGNEVLVRYLKVEVARENVKKAYIQV